MMAQRVHLPNFADIPNCQLVALAEARRSLGEKVQRRYDIPRLYSDHRGLIEDPEIDAIAVSAPFAIQAEVARECLAAGKHVFMEKPMALSVAQAERIIAAGRASGARLMVGYMKRYDPGNELAHATIAAWRSSGELGAIVYARAHGFGGDWTAGIDYPPFETTAEAPPVAPTAEYLPEWLPAEHARGYVNYLQQYTHNVNLLRFLLDAGDQVRVKFADLDDTGYAGTVVFDVAGTRATLETGSLRYYRWDEHTQVYFERGWVHTWAPPLLLRNAVAEVEIYRSDENGAPNALGTQGVQHTATRAIPEPRYGWAYKREAVHFVECLRSGVPFGSTAEDTLTDVRLFEEIYRTWLQR
jgi:predicted dehydrogenase